MARSFTYLAAPFVFVSLALGACGGKSFESADNGGSSSAGTESDGGSQSVGGTHAGGSSAGGSHAAGTSTGGSHAAGTSAGGGSTGGGSTGGGSTGGTGGASSCDMYDDQTGGAVSVVITNDTKVPLYLGARMAGCGNGRLFQVADATDTPLFDPPLCGTFCEDVIKHATRGCPPIACAVQAPITLLPGEGMSTQWSGLFAVDAMLNKACLPAGANAECTRIVAVRPGDFVFSAEAGSALDCSQFQDGVCPACQQNGTGGCFTPGAVVSGAEHTAKLKVKLDASYGVGSTGGGGMVQSVQISFEN